MACLLEMKLSWLSDWWPISLSITFTWSSLEMQCCFLPSLLYFFCLSRGLRGKQESPWNKNLKSWNSLLYVLRLSLLCAKYYSNSKTMHPKLHISDAWSYYFSIIDISGALYHLEPTWSDIYLFYCCLRGLSSTSVSVSLFSVSCNAYHVSFPLALLDAIALVLMVFKL